MVIDIKHEFEEQNFKSRSMMGGGGIMLIIANTLFLSHAYIITKC